MSHRSKRKIAVEVSVIAAVLDGQPVPWDHPGLDERAPEPPIADLLMNVGEAIDKEDFATSGITVGKTLPGQPTVPVHIPIIIAVDAQDLEGLAAMLQQLAGSLSMLVCQTRGWAPRYIVVSGEDDGVIAMVARGPERYAVASLCLPEKACVFTMDFTITPTTFPPAWVEYVEPTIMEAVPELEAAFKRERPDLHADPTLN